jgi:2-methylcitrate dehydratase PrpD
MSGTPSISTRLARFIHSISFDDLPATTVEMARTRILDALATAIASRALPVPATALRFVEANRGEGTVIGQVRRFPAIDAAFVNATLINGTTHDDFLQKSHAGAVAIPAAFAVGEELGSSGREVLTSVVLGYDLVARAYLGGPSMLPRFRASGVAGAIGSAASAAKLYGLPEAGMANALGCAAMFASGFGEGFRAGTMDVKLNVGWAARSGVSAAQLARAGATSAPRVFEGESGFFKAFAGSAQDAEEAVRGLGERFLIEDAVYKERPVCIFVQTPVHLAHEFAAQHRCDPRQIERVSIHAPLATFTNPGYTNTAPFGTPLQARISARFCVAAALLGRPVDEYKFYEHTDDADVLALAGKIELIEPPERTPTAGDEVRLDIVAAGKTYHCAGVEMDMLRPSTERVVAKFRRLAEPALGKGTEQVLDRVFNLEALAHIRQLTDALRDALHEVPLENHSAS